MSKSNKVLSIALALVMVLGIFSICSFATATTPTGTVTLVADNASVGNGETVTITVKASAAETFYAGPMSIPVLYDTTLFTLGTVTVNDVFGSGVTEKITNTATAGKVIVTAIPKTDGSPVAPDLSAADLVIATITFTSAASPATGAGTFSVDDDQKTTTNTNGKFYIGSFDGSDPKTAELTSMGQTLNRVPVDVNVGAELDIELTATGTSNGVIIDTHKTFGGTYAGVIYGFPQVANATFRTIAYIQTNLQKTDGSQIVAADLARTIGTAGYGTGTTITVGSKVYVIVIFGDVNGDGFINLNDTTLVKQITSNASLAPNDSVVRLAANCAMANAAAMMHTVNLADTTAVKNYVGGNKFSPAALAAKHASFNTRYQ